MKSRELKLRTAVNKLSKYNGLYTLKDLAGNEEYRATEASRRLEVSNRDSTASQTGPTTLEQGIIELFIDTSEGVTPTVSLLSQLANLTTTQEEKDTLWEVFQVFYSQELQNRTYGTAVDNLPDILTILGYSSNSEGVRFNKVPNNPTKEFPALSVIVSNSHRVGLVQRDTNPSVIFLNSIPNIEMSRATPFIDIQMSIGRPAKNSGTKQIQTMSLSRFLVGASQADGDNALNDLVMGNQIFNGDPIDRENGEIKWSEARAVAGMELFTSPQTLVNANESDNEFFRSNPVLDKFKPLMSIKGFSVNIVPTAGMMSYKTAKLELILHDRSRLSEVADFVRADLYGSTELTIEYGWTHPDGESNASERNPYGDLINGMRIKEKYSILNSSFSLGDGGEMAINLDLFTRGGESFETELISSDDAQVGNIIREIQDLQRDIAELRARVFGTESGATSREIRGVQILDAAQDAMNNITLSGELRTAIVAFRRAMNGTHIPAAQDLIDRLGSLYGNVTAGNRRGAQPGLPAQAADGEPAAVRLRRSIQDSVSAKMTKLLSDEDPFIIGNRTVTGRNPVPGTRAAEGVVRAGNVPIHPANGNSVNKQVSFAKLMLLFVGEPLAHTGKYDDVQLVFYPFNSYAGRASETNIANFAVDAQFFADNFARWRLERVGRSANVNLSDFVNFVGTTILDDPAARSYGLVDATGKSLFQTVSTDDNGRTAVSLQAIGEPADHMHNIELALREYTPDGTFRPPQIDIFLECNPEKQGTTEGQPANGLTEKTILKVHIFDRLATSYDTLGTLLANQRNTEFEAVGTNSAAPPVRDSQRGSTGNPAVVESRRQIHSAYLAAAEASSIVEKTYSGEGQDRQQIYRIVGGPRRLKDFLYKTVPYITYGTVGTNILNASLSSNQEPALNTINLLRSFRRSELEPNGENPGGLPMRIIPTTLGLSTVGCPLINFAQSYFVDFQTGTTADNIYAVSGLTHTLGPGEFKTDIKFAPLDAYGRYIGVIDQIRNSQTILQDIQDNATENSTNASSI